MLTIKLGNDVSRFLYILWYGIKTHHDFNPKKFKPSELLKYWQDMTFHYSYPSVYNNDTDAETSFNSAIEKLTKYGCLSIKNGLCSLDLTSRATLAEPFDHLIHDELVDLNSFNYDIAYKHICDRIDDLVANMYNTINDVSKMFNKRGVNEFMKWILFDQMKVEISDVVWRWQCGLSVA